MTIVEEMQKFRDENVNVSEEEIKEVISKVREYFLGELQEEPSSTYFSAYIVWGDSNNRMMISEKESVDINKIPEEKRKYITEIVENRAKRGKYFEKLISALKEECSKATLQNVQIHVEIFLK